MTPQKPNPNPFNLKKVERDPTKGLSNKIFQIIFIILILLNIIIFIYANSRPLLWQNGEMTFHKFFWSMDGINTFTLHSGLRPADLLKPFATNNIDGDFRMRQFAYFLEMITFKFWQFFELITFRDFTLMGIHVINAILLGFLVFSLVGSSLSAWLAGLILLNSGASLATILFPFLNTRLLVMTLFLIGWLSVSTSQRKFVDGSRLRWLSFFIVLFLALCTDEFALLTFPLIFFYIALRDGMSGLINKRMLKAFVLILYIYAITVFLSFITLKAIDQHMSFRIYGYHLGQSIQYLTQFSTIKDTFVALFSYFLRRNFGYWDLTFLGSTAAIASIILFFMAIRAKPQPLIYRLGWAIAIALGVKAIFLPHPAGLNRFFMPEGTQFPSLLFFSFYYVYFDAVLWALLLGLFLKTFGNNFKRGAIVLCLVTTINLSNAWHLKDGPSDVLTFHYWDKENKRKIAADVLAIKEVLSQNRGLKTYLSFPVGDSSLFKRGIYIRPPLLPEILYSSIIPVIYLRSFEKGKVSTSLLNIKLARPYQNGSELTDADIFYDVCSHRRFNFEFIRRQMGTKALMPLVITDEPIKVRMDLAGQNQIDRVVFFIKGIVGFTLKTQDLIIEDEQSYGLSYQMFEYAINQKVDSSSSALSAISVELALHSLKKDQMAFLIGPFVITK